MQVPISNQYGEDEKGNPIYIDRIYQGLSNKMRLINKDGSEYHGAINKKAISVKGKDGVKFRSFVHETADGRWFDRSGMPIEKPSNLITKKESEEQESQENSGNLPG
jgi:hypothetical protein